MRNLKSIKGVFMLALIVVSGVFTSCESKKSNEVQPIERITLDLSAFNLSGGTIKKGLTPDQMRDNMNIVTGGYSLYIWGSNVLGVYVESVPLTLITSGIGDHYRIDNIDITLGGSITLDVTGSFEWSLLHPSNIYGIETPAKDYIFKDDNNMYYSNEGSRFGVDSADRIYFNGGNLTNDEIKSFSSTYTVDGSTAFLPLNFANSYVYVLFASEDVKTSVDRVLIHNTDNSGEQGMFYPTANDYLLGTIKDYNNYTVIVYLKSGATVMTTFDSVYGQGVYFNLVTATNGVGYDLEVLTELPTDGGNI